MRKKQKHQTPNTETQVPITKSIITERIFRLSILMFVMCLKKGRPWMTTVAGPVEPRSFGQKCMCLHERLQKEIQNRIGEVGALRLVRKWEPAP